MAEPVRHRQTKGAATDMFDLQLPRHTSTLPALIVARSWRQWPAQSSAFTDRRAMGGKALTAELRALAWVGGSHERPCCAFDRRRNL